MHATRSRYTALARTSARALLTALAIVLGVMLAGVQTAFAQQDVPASVGMADEAEVLSPQAFMDMVDEGAEEQGGDAGLVPQDSGEATEGSADAQNYAVFDQGTYTLTFLFGPLPEGTAGTDYCVGFDTTTRPYAGDGDRPWYPKKTSIKHVVFDDSVVGHLKPWNTAWWFGQFYSLEDVLGLANLDTSNVRSMMHMFDNCSNKLAALDLSVLDTANVTSMRGMFHACAKLKDPDLTGFNTSKVTNMEAVFRNCKALEAIGLSSWDFSGAYSLTSMFEGCTSLVSVNLGRYASSPAGPHLSSLFSGCTALQSLDLSAWDTGNVKSMNKMLNGCTSLTDLNLTGLNTAEVSDYREMFKGCASLATLDLSNFDTSKGSFMGNMFQNCGALRSVTLGEGFRFLGNGISIESNAANLPVPVTTETYNGLWWKGPGTMSYDKYGMRRLSAAELAGTWTWSEGVAVVLSPYPGAGGTVSASPQNTGLAGGSVTLAATPAAGYQFVGWELTSGEDTGTLASVADNPCTFTFGTANGAVRARFEAATYEYTIGALSSTSFIYSGAAQAPTIAVTDVASGTVLYEGTHYQLSFEKAGVAVASPTDAGTYTAYVTGAGDYASMAKTSAGTFTIRPAGITSVSAAGATYTGGTLKPTPTVKAGGLAVPAGSYSTTYANNTNAGTATVTVSGKGNFAGSKSATFKIAAASLSGKALVLSKTSYTYNGKVQKPTVKTVGVKHSSLAQTTSSPTPTQARRPPEATR